MMALVLLSYFQRNYKTAPIYTYFQQCRLIGLIFTPDFEILVSRPSAIHKQ